MGTYTRFKCRIKLAYSVPDEVVNFLTQIIDFTKKEIYHDDDVITTLFAHELFRCMRWENLFYAHPDGSDPVFKKIGNTWILELDAEFKNYDSEIEKFIDWITPFVKIGRKNKIYLGWSKNENSDNQRYYHVKKQEAIK